MDQIPDPTNVTTWPAALVAVVLIVAVLVVPSVLTYLGNKHIKAVKTTLQDNNGGSSVRDSLDRIETGVATNAAATEALTVRVTALETKPKRRKFLGGGA